MIKSVLAIFTATCLVSACARQPTAIAPADVSPGAYSELGCKALATELYSAETKLGQLSAAQSAEASKDAAWVAGGVLFLPVALVAAGGADHSGEIATLKGQQNALKAQMVSQGC